MVLPTGIRQEDRVVRRNDRSNHYKRYQIRLGRERYLLLLEKLHLICPSITLQEPVKRLLHQASKKSAHILVEITKFYYEFNFKHVCVRD